MENNEESGKTQNYIEIFDESKSYILNEEIESIKKE